MPLMSYCFPNDISWTFGHLHCQNLLPLPIFGRMRYGSTELITIVAVPCFIREHDENGYLILTVGLVQSGSYTALL
ncbi:hypothetical protein [Photorhabdus laumondii]|nr:hypothetical protein [Photorhabdus laumondii]